VVDQTESTTHHETTKVRGLMLEYVDRVAERLGYMRIDKQTALSARLRDALRSDSADAILEELRLSIARRPELLAAAQSEGELMECVSDLIDAAIIKVARDAGDAALYSAAGEVDRDPDPSFRRGALKASAKNWE
jgi:hypothetical protein